MQTGAKSPAKAGVLVPQPHGGQLRCGSKPGTNRGGTGRPPSSIRERLRGSFDERVAVLEDIADSEAHSTADRLRAIDLLAKYGLGTTKELTVENVQERLRGTVALIRAELPASQAEPLLARMRELWR